MPVYSVTRGCYASVLLIPKWDWRLLVSLGFHVYVFLPSFKETKMNEVLTVLKSVSGHALAKIFSGTALTQQPFSIGSQYNVTEEPVSNLQSLSALLHRLEDDPTHTIIRGSLTEGQSSPVPRNKKTFTATPRQWCMIDIDSLAWDGDISDQQAMLSYAIHRISYRYQYTEVMVGQWYTPSA